VNRRAAYTAVFLILVLFPLGTMAYKLFVLDYPLTGLVPTMTYRVSLSMQVDGHGEDIQIATFLPSSDLRQTVTDEEHNSGPFAFSVLADGGNRRAEWTAEGVRGQNTVVYSYTVHGRHVRYELPADLAIPNTYPPEISDYLQAAPGIQVEDPLIAARLQQLFPEGDPDLITALTRIHRHLQDTFENRDFSGYTDALTALKLGEASCNGKSRLFVAMARALNIPARLVGGLILEQGVKRVTHQWVEVYVNGHWVPFDAVNDWFAEIPAHYLTLYYGDLVLFKHTSAVNFQYFFKTNKRLVPRHEVMETLDDSPFNVLNFYAVFERVGISQNLLKIILMLPFGALVTVIFRNVIGVETFGTFLPALIAAAARETGLFWGALGFALIIMVSAIVRKGLEWLHLLHSPKMAIMLTIVIVIMLGSTVFAVNAGLYEFAHITLFPIAILAITAERFALIETEQGLPKALRIMMVTLMVMAACYVVMDSQFLQSLVLAFPELLLVLIAMNLWLGKWMGIRVLEFIRFRRLIFGAAREAAPTR